MNTAGEPRMITNSGRTCADTALGEDVDVWATAMAFPTTYGWAWEAGRLLVAFPVAMAGDVTRVVTPRALPGRP